MFPLIGALAAPVLEGVVGNAASGVLQMASGAQPQAAPGNVVQNLASGALGMLSNGIGSLL